MTSGQNHDQRRPSSISPHVWWKMTTKVERIQWWLDSPDAESATKSLPSVDCSPLGTSSLKVVTAISVIQTWPYHRYQESEMPTDSGPTSDGDNNTYLNSDESRQEYCPWDVWDAYAQELDSSNVTRCAVCSPSATSVPQCHSRKTLLHGIGNR